MSSIRRATRNRKLLFSLVAPPIAALIAVLGLFVVGAFQGPPAPVAAQGLPPRCEVPQGPHAERLCQIANALVSGEPGAADAAMNALMENLYGGMRILPSPGDEVQGNGETTAANTLRWHAMTTEDERDMAMALEALANRTDLADPIGGFGGGIDVDELQRNALDLKLMVEQISEVAEAVGRITRDCGVGQDIADTKSVCNDLLPLLDEDNAQLIGGGATPAGFNTVLRPSFSVKLRSPIVPRGAGSFPFEDVLTTSALAPDECSVVFKEMRGLMLKLHLDRVTVIGDPWVGPSGLPRGTRVPVWRLEWVPAEYVRTWEMCNSNGQIKVDMSQHVKQLEPLTFFWRFYPSQGFINNRFILP